MIEELEQARAAVLAIEKDKELWGRVPPEHLRHQREQLTFACAELNALRNYQLRNALTTELVVAAMVRIGLHWGENLPGYPADAVPGLLEPLLAAAKARLGAAT